MKNYFFTLINVCVLTAKNNFVIDIVIFVIKLLV